MNGWIIDIVLCSVLSLVLYMPDSYTHYTDNANMGYTIKLKTIKLVDEIKELHSLFEIGPIAKDDFVIDKL